MGKMEVLRSSAMNKDKSEALKDSDKSSLAGAGAVVVTKILTNKERNGSLTKADGDKVTVLKRGELLDSGDEINLSAEEEEEDSLRARLVRFLLNFVLNEILLFLQHIKFNFENTTSVHTYAWFTRGQDNIVLSLLRTSCPSLNRSLEDRTMGQDIVLEIDGQVISAGQWLTPATAHGLIVPV